MGPGPEHPQDDAPDPTDAPTPSAAPIPAVAHLELDDADAVEDPAMLGAPPPVAVQHDILDSIVPALDVADDETDHGPAGPLPPAPDATDHGVDAPRAATPAAAAPDPTPTPAKAGAAPKKAASKGGGGGKPPKPKKKKRGMGCAIGAIVALLVLGCGFVTLAAAGVVGAMLFTGGAVYSLSSMRDDELTRIEEMMDDEGIVDEVGVAPEATPQDTGSPTTDEPGLVEADEDSTVDEGEGDGDGETPPEAATPATTPPVTPTAGTRAGTTTTKPPTPSNRSGTTATPATTTKPEPAATTTPAPTNRTATQVPSDKARISVTGGAKVVLVKRGSRYPVPGNVTSGKYDIEATFEGGEPVVVGTIKVEAGQPATIACNARMGICRAQ